MRGPAREPATAPPRVEYHPSLDGLRAIAVLAVMAFHADLPGARGGFLGVDVFFVLSGFLITTILLRELRDTGTIAIGRFYVRRALRLLPAVYVLLATLHVYSYQFPFPEQVAQLRREIWATLLYVANWAQVTGWVPSLGLLGHAWSLAIEEQFYLLWPGTLLVLVRVLPRRSIASLLALVAVAAAIWRFWLWEGVRTFPRVYFGFDTRVDTLLLGAMTAFVLDARGARDGGPALRWIAGIAAAGLAVMFLRASWLARSMYAGGFTVVATATCIVIAALWAQPEARLTRLLAARPLVAVGRLSYALYLWHWPMLFFVPAVTGVVERPLMLAIWFPASFAVAALSYVVVERPALRLKRRWS